MSEQDKNTHLTHLEDHVIDNGKEGTNLAIRTLYGLHDALKGRKSSTKTTIKKDGAPAIFTGHKDGKFFVATKSLFNKNAKINYSHDDIERNHGHAPGLVDKLKQAHDHLQKVIPNDGKIYQGDLMYGKGDVTSRGDQYSFKANTIRYSTNKDSAEGQKIAKAKIGVAFHTSYNNGKVEYGFDPHTLPHHDDVHLISPIMKHGASSSYTSETQNNFKSAMKDVMRKNLEVNHGHHRSVEPHRAHMNIYINSTVRDDSKPSAAGYISFLQGRASKDKKVGSLIPHAQQHHDNIQRVLDLHSSVRHAKHVLIGALDNHDHTYHHEIEGNAAKPEGYVAVDKNRPSKFVNRSVFSRANFAKPKDQKFIKETTMIENFIKKLFAKKPKKTVVFSFGRMNPPTVGHEKLVNKVKEVAQQHNADHKIVLSHSSDAKKNPLSPAKKLMHAKRMFPGTNLSVSSKEKPSFIHHFKDLHDAGHKHLIVVVGSDRTKEIENMANKYNGKEYNFHSIKVVSSGARDDADEGVSGMSASKMRKHAASNNFEKFKEGVPSHLSDDHAKELYDDVRKGMGVS